MFPEINKRMKIKMLKAGIVKCLDRTIFNFYSLERNLFLKRERVGNVDNSLLKVQVCQDRGRSSATEQRISRAIGCLNELPPTYWLGY